MGELRLAMQLSEPATIHWTAADFDEYIRVQVEKATAELRAENERLKLALAAKGTEHE